MTFSTRLAVPALLGALILSVPAAARAEQKETERVDRTAQIRAGGQLKLKNFSGHVTITGSNRGDVSIHAIRRATRDRLEHIKLDVQENGADVTIEANRKDSDWRDRDNNVVETDFDIEVPLDTSVDVDVFSSDVTVTSVRGKQRVKTFSGDVNLSGGEQSVNAETFSGKIDVLIPQGTSASVDFDSFSGELRTDVPMVYRSSSRRRVRAEIGAGGTDYYFKTFSGDVRIR
jgi:putative adhesin